MKRDSNISTITNAYQNNYLISKGNFAAGRGYCLAFHNCVPVARFFMNDETPTVIQNGHGGVF